MAGIGNGSLIPGTGKCRFDALSRLALSGPFCFFLSVFGQTVRPTVPEPCCLFRHAIDLSVNVLSPPVFTKDQPFSSAVIEAKAAFVQTRNEFPVADVG